jgi:fumarate hydratase class II
MSNKITRQAFREHIREIILDEAKKTKKKSKDIAPQEDVDIDFNMDDEQSSNDTQPSNDTVAPETGEMGDINPTVKSIQDSLQKAFAQAKQLGDAKLATQIGNTLTMLLRDQVLGQNVSENLNEENWRGKENKLLIHIASKLKEINGATWDTTIKELLADLKTAGYGV